LIRCAILKKIGDTGRSRLRTGAPMTSPALFAFLHHAAAFLLVAVVMVELVLLRGELTLASARTLLRMDAVYGASAGILLIVGFVRVFQTEKGADYYFHSGPFLVKLALFILVGLLSIVPTVKFLGWRKALQAGQSPSLDDAMRRRLRTIIHIELTLLFIIMLCAALMARGIGFIG
jgi:putative membrane protein